MRRLLASLVSVVLATALLADAPVLQSVAPVLGPKLFRDGDVVEITDLQATSPQLEPGDTIVVRGRIRLDSRPHANLCLFLTQTEGDGWEETDKTQRQEVESGLHDFELKTTIKHRGALHVTLYDSNTGRPFGGTYFGTADQMHEIADWDLGYYLED
ncbi:MAG: hypothetical protein AAGF97_19485 [Planctomycetota bacterium]